MNLIQILGLIGGVLFGYAAVPQAIRTIKSGRHLGTPLDIIVTIFTGTLVMYTYLYLAYGFNWVLTVNYSVEASSWGVLLFYRLFRMNMLDPAWPEQDDDEFVNNELDRLVQLRDEAQKAGDKAKVNKLDDEIVALGSLSRFINS